jgi:ERCC4-related helicase
LKQLDKYSLNCINENNTSNLINTIKKSNNDPKYFSVKLPKITKLIELLMEHFRRRIAGGTSTRAIVFTEYRVTVSEIVESLECIPGKKAVKWLY